MYNKIIDAEYFHDTQHNTSQNYQSFLNKLFKQQIASLDSQIVSIPRYSKALLDIGFREGFWDDIYEQ